MKYSKRNHLTIIFLFIASIFVQYYFINPIVFSDQMEYFRSAVIFPKFSENPSHWNLRLGLIIPVSILFRMFGYAEFTYYLIPVLCMAFLITLVFLLGETLFNYRVGLMSAFWMLFMPGIYLESGHLLPDIPATCCMLAGLTLLIINNKSKNKDKPSSSRKIFILYILSGAFFGWSYLIKEYFLFFFILVPIYFLISKIPIRYLFAFLAGAFLVAFFELFIGFIIYQNPFIRFDAISPRDIWGHVEKDIGIIVSYLPSILNRNGNNLTFLLALISIIGSIPQILKKNKELLFLLAWVVLIYGFYTGLGLLPVIFNWEKKVLLRPFISRYWIPIFPPLIISGIAIIEMKMLSILKKIKVKIQFSNFITYCLLFFMIIISGFWGYYQIKDDENLIRNGNDHYLELRNYLQVNNQPTGGIWVIRDISTEYDHILRIYTRDFWGKEIWYGKIRHLNNDRDFMHLYEITSGYVIVDREYYHPDYNNPVPDYLETPPEIWDIVFESENGRIAVYSANK